LKQGRFKITEMEFSNERKISFNLEKIARFLNGFLLILMISSGLAGFMWNTNWYWLTSVTFFLNALNFYYLYIQKQHALLANFGILALFRYLVESIGPEFRQYLYSSDTEEKPFNRIDRADVYKKAKNTEKSSAFGSLLDFDSKALKLKHSFYPVDINKLQPFRVCFGEERNLKQAYTINKAIMVGGMSYGALGRKAIHALSLGAKKAGILLNTGEGGYPKYHLMGGADLIFQMGTAKFGVRNEDGSLNPDLLEKIARLDQVKMIEIKFSQGAKPGKGGFLPKEKITEEIAELRGIPIGKDVISPAGHKECVSAESTVRFIRKIQEISLLPTGIKFCLGSTKEMGELFLEMKKQNIYPDYISIDGSEGGTGAAPKTFMDDLGYPLFPALEKVISLIEEHKVTGKFKIVTSGKLIRAGRQMMALCMGASAIYTARGFMLAMGCIQALRCNNNTCPVGITTHSEKLQHGLDIKEKAERVSNYVLNLDHHHYEMLAAMGETKFSDLTCDNLIIPT
ncbi:MAG: FMN-binding glutamate synthase family protein, partial [Bdellovibrionales bacterium]|nr:FMN-binding glutamate synthase family protein [Bdellovibrionales bacterium]